MKRCFVTGITGQDGSYMAEILLARGFEVHGIIRRSSSFNTWRIQHRFENQPENDKRLFLYYGDLADGSNLAQLLAKIRPDYVFHLGAQSHVRISFEIPEYTADVTGVGTLRLLEAIRSLGLPDVRFYQASSSEMFGSSPPPQSETTPFSPRSPYAAAKVFAYHLTKNYRESYGMFASNGILFNHESPRRGENFVTRKITLNLARIKHGMASEFRLGNLDAKRDWGYALDYMEAALRILEHDRPDDFVIATGESHSVRELAETAAAELGMRIEWRGKGLDEVGIDAETGRTIIRIDPKYFRPAEVDWLQGDASKARELLGWAPQTSFRDLVSLMVKSDEALVRSRKGDVS